MWEHEALDFTKWLSGESSLNMLGSAVGIELELIETESSVGSFNVDIFAQVAGTGRKVIENRSLFEGRLGLEAKPFDAKKASGLRFYKDDCKIKGNEDAWPGFIKDQLKWALIMKQLIGELGL